MSCPLSDDDPLHSGNSGAPLTQCMEQHIEYLLMTIKGLAEGPFDHGGLNDRREVAVLLPRLPD